MEVLVSPYGAGALSIALWVSGQQWDDEVIPLDEVKRFNYRLSPLRRKGTVPELAISQASLTPALKEDSKGRVRPPPAAEAPLHERLGVAGGMFTLRGRFPTRTACGGARFQADTRQLSVYPVVGLGNAVDFGDPAVRGALGPLVAGLAQVEEPGHAGAPPRSEPDVPKGS
jgi:hypothetical protein